MSVLLVDRTANHWDLEKNIAFRKKKIPKEEDSQYYFSCNPLVNCCRLEKYLLDDYSCVTHVKVLQNCQKL